MWNQDERHPAIGWHRFEKPLERIEPPCGSANAGDGET
jgi:hypothetical protein